ncbi:MAG: hypothetical protein K2N16_00330, partial [Muribaculaceae bacterium]|nr:hypothetical protein [Muribaculaceae bacterium]
TQPQSAPKPHPAPTPPPTAPIEEKIATPTRHNVYVFELPTTVGTMAEFTVNTDHIIEDSPIEGYEAAIVREGAGHVNRLYYKEDRSLMTMLKQRGPWALGGLIVGVVAALLFTCGRGGDAPAPVETPVDTVDTAMHAVAQPAEVVEVEPVAQQPVEEPKLVAENTPVKTQEQTPPEAPATETSVSAQAISYLDNNKTWTKTELDKFPELKGLFEDLNSVNRSRIIDYWGPKLTASKTFTDRIVKHTNLGKRKKPRKTPYTSDGKINVQGWLNNVDP